MSNTLSPPETTPPGLAEFAAGAPTRRGPREPRKPSPAPPPHAPAPATPAYGTVDALKPTASTVTPAAPVRGERALPADARSVMIGVRVRDQVDRHLLRVLTDLRLDHGVETTRTELLEMLLWEDAQATPAFATRIRRFREAHPALRRRV